MSDSSSRIIRLHQIDNLFSSPQADPFHPHFQTLSGIEQITSLLKTGVPPNELHIIFVLPASTPRQDTLKSEMQDAIERYSDAMISTTYLERTERRRTILRNLAIGVLVLGVSLGLGAAISGAEFLSSALRNLLSNTISILGTVALWSPVDALLFGLQPLRNNLKIYHAIKSLSFELQFTATE